MSKLTDKLFEDDEEIEIESEELEIPVSEETEEIKEEVKEETEEIKEEVKEEKEEIEENTKKNKKPRREDETATEEFNRQRAEINTLLDKLEQLRKRLSNKRLSPIMKFFLTIKFSILETRIERALQYTKMRMHINEWGARDEIADKQIEYFREDYSNTLEEVEKQQRVVEAITADMIQKGITITNMPQEIKTTTKSNNSKREGLPVKTQSNNNGKTNTKREIKKENENKENDKEIKQPVIKNNDLENKLKEAQEKLKELEAERDLKKAQLEENEKEYEEYIEYSDKQPKEILKAEDISWWKGFKMAISRIFSNLKESKNHKKSLANALKEADKAAKAQIRKEYRKEERRNNREKVEDLREELYSIEDEREEFAKKLEVRVAALNKKYGIEPKEDEEKAQEEVQKPVETPKVESESIKIEEPVVVDSEEIIETEEPVILNDEETITEEPIITEENKKDLTLEELLDASDVDEKFDEIQKEIAEKVEAAKVTRDYKAEYEEAVNKAIDDINERTDEINGESAETRESVEETLRQDRVILEEEGLSYNPEFYKAMQDAMQNVTESIDKKEKQNKLDNYFERSETAKEVMNRRVRESLMQNRKRRLEEEKEDEER